MSTADVGSAGIRRPAGARSPGAYDRKWHDGKPFTARDVEYWVQRGKNPPAGVLITLIVYAFNVLGDGLRDVLDPRLRQ